MLSSVMPIPYLNTLNLDVIPLDVIPGTPFRRYSFRRYSFRRYSRPLSFSFSLFKLCLGFRGCPNILFRNEVIHSYPYYLPLWKTGFCWFSKEKPQIFWYKNVFSESIFCIFQMFSSYKQMVFSAIEARFRRILMRTIAILPGFSTFSNNSRTRLRYKWFSGTRKLAQAQKEMKVG